MQSPSFLGKYGRILLAMALFLALDLSVLLLNIFTADRLQTDGSEINIAGRQRMLSQRMTKVLFEMQDAQSHGNGIAPLQKELKTAFDLFDATFYAFLDGGTTRDSNLNVIQLSKIETPAAQEALQKAHKPWEAFKEAIRPTLLATDAIDADTLTQAIHFAAENNLSLLTNMNELTTALEQDSTSRTDRLRWIQAGSIILILLIFFYIMWEFYGQVQRSDREVEQSAEFLQATNQELEKASQELARAQQDTDLILSTVRQGLMLIGNDYKIGEHYSNECTEIFRMESLAGYSFLGLMQRLLTEKLYNTTRDYLELLFDANRKEKQILKVNPLDVVEVNFSNPAGGFITKYLGFNFRRIVENGVVSRVFVGVADITQQVKLERELRETELKKEKQLTFLLGMLHADAKLVKEFIESAKAGVQQITETLRAQDFATAANGKMEDLQERINKVFRIVHTIKGNASMLQLSYFEKSGDEFEAKLNQLRSRPSLSGDDFLTVVIEQSKLRDDLKELEEIHLKLGDLRGPALRLSASLQKNAVPEEDQLISSLRGLVGNIAQRLGKVVKVEAADFDSKVFSEPDRLVLRDVLIQLTRNSLAHSLEKPEERQRAGKPREGVIAIKPVRHPETGMPGFTFTDDGRGLDVKKIRERAVTNGLFSAEDAENQDESSLAPLIFMPGFSTADIASTDAGQGIGMDIIKQKIVDERGGEITVDAEAGQNCSFGIYLPN